MMTDPVADMLTRIRNAALARHDRTEVPASKMKQAVAEILKSEGYIADVRPSDGNPGKLTIVLKYGRDRSSAIDGVRRVSRPGRRVYVKHDRIPRVLSGLGISILSTSHGLMSDRDARKNKLGGELICEVW
ncbi:MULTISPECIES: 30S ribosomal protein S8 [Polyangium]|uniref:Small ribosomal subunit protein uS8 n=1 Tax=Polyangium jinanense TaxID=2829994 RepID=A0A9X3X1W9_9BACT|nr:MULTISPECIES: 30S ribosomal protein S8 [Polyangium]MDC3952247.1 30S ribosomal protein S8 [Polyangium jinanense]MDC3956392.1 30S ribosomal protein S8 [Polyangium jinanense]MDC3979876.1 30S ribosomal protein S8 [Polyangium jinanense]MDC3982529.1 30S ribosomal protein S8 [Polyangium jinanense]MDI1450033.1 30S ribosomal protein S8 [Polyangium sp. 6x1]